MTAVLELIVWLALIGALMSGVFVAAWVLYLDFKRMERDGH